MKFLHTQLDNGLAIVGEQNPNAQSLAIGYFVRTGARDETSEIAGVSHFLEHMMFKGTERRSAERVNLEFDELGADYNAFTSEEATVYFGRVLPEFQARLLDLLTDMMRPSLRAEDFDLEKNVILEEIARAEDSPFHVAYWATRQHFFDGHPLGNVVIGTPDSVKALTREQMLRYFERRYSPGNMTLVLTGNFDWDAAVRKADRDTANWQPFETSRDLSVPPYRTLREVMTTDKFKRVHLMWMFPGVTAQDEARYAAAVLAAAVGDDVGSRLYWALVDPGIVDEASLAHYPEDHAGLFLAYASCEPDRAAEVIEVVSKTLSAVVDSGLTEDEMQRAKQKIASGQVIQAENPMGRLRSVGQAWMYRREYRTVDEAVNRLLAVTPAEVQALLQARPFDTQTLIALGPIDALE